VIAYCLLIAAGLLCAWLLYGTHAAQSGRTRVERRRESTAPIEAGGCLLAGELDAVSGSW
jgi:hypothetical protein